MDVVILGAGPCGISAAIALAKITAEDPNTMPLHITLVELRPRLQTKGGTVNITPLGMRYIDYLGAGSRLRARSISLDHGVDLVSLRTGRRLGTSWGGIGGRRTARYPLAQSLLETLRQSHPEVRIQWGRNVMAISESDDKVELKFDDQSMLLCDLLLGCDGIHSAARRLYVEPSREKAYTGRAVAMGWVDSVGGSTAPSPITLANGEPGLIDTVGIKGSQSVLIMTYFEPSRSKVFFANAMQADEPREGGDRDGWKILGANQDAIRQEVLNSYSNGYVSGLEDTLAKCENWDLYPIYALPPGGIWSKGRVLLLGDAAHAMPPQGESTGIAIEDGVLIARVLRRRSHRSVQAMVADYEHVRRAVIDQHYQDAVRMQNITFPKVTGFASIAMEWVSSIFIYIRNWNQVDHFAGDNEGDVKLPAVATYSTQLRRPT